MEPSSSSSNFPATLQVDQHGGDYGAYVSIAKAIHDAAPGTRIIVEAGTYEESLLIDKPLVIIGSGPAHVTVQSKKGSCLEVGVDGVIVRGLTLRGFSNAYPAVTLYKDTVLETCDVSSEAHCCIIVGGGAIPTIRRCRIHNGGECGLVLIQDTRCVVEECEVFGNRSHGITVQHASPVIRKCRIHGNGESGVQVWDDADATVEDCDVFDQRLNGVEISTKAKVALRRCCIHHCDVNAILFYEQATGLVEDCEVYANRCNGICLQHSSKPSGLTIRRCKMHQCAFGVVVKDKGLGIIDQCEICENAQSGVRVMSGQLTIKRSRIHHQLSGSGIKAGFMALGQARVVVLGCEITDNASVGVCVEDGGDVVIDDSKFAGNETAIERNFGGNVRVTNCNLPDDDSESEETEPDDGDDWEWDDDDGDHDDDDIGEDDEANPAHNEPDLSSVEPTSNSVVDEAAAKMQLNDLLEQASKVNWVNLYHDATTGRLLPGHELCMEAGTDPSVILRPKVWSAAAKPDNASWLKLLGGDPSAKPSENLEQLNAVLEAFGIKKDKLDLLASIYPIHADLKAWWLDFARRHLGK